MPITKTLGGAFVDGALDKVAGKCLLIDLKYSHKILLTVFSIFFIISVHDCDINFQQQVISQKRWATNNVCENSLLSIVTAISWSMPKDNSVHIK